MRVSDFAGRPGLTLEAARDFRSVDDTLFRGAFWHRELRRGLFVHASDGVEDAGFTASSMQRAGLSCVFFLDGEVAAGFGDREFDLHGRGRLESGLLVVNARDESFQRKSHGGQRLRHLVVSVTPEWLDRDGLATMNDPGLAGSLAQDHLASRRWAVSTRLAGLVDRILGAGRGPSPLRDLLVESAAVEIVAEAIAAGSRQDVRDLRAPLSPYDTARLRKAIDFLRASPRSWPSVEAVAREAGVSTSSLQRLFHAGLGTSVVEFIRGLRLDAAREALEAGYSVQSATAVAGYSSAANFATAFKRRFGLTPGQARSRG